MNSLNTVYDRDFRLQSLQISIHYYVHVIVSVNMEKWTKKVWTPHAHAQCTCIHMVEKFCIQRTPTFEFKNMSTVVQIMTFLPLCATPTQEVILIKVVDRCRTHVGQLKTLRTKLPWVQPFTFCNDLKSCWSSQFPSALHWVPCICLFYDQYISSVHDHHTSLRLGTRTTIYTT